MVQSAYVALYKAVMNINEDGRQPHGWHGLEGDRWIKRDTPTLRNYNVIQNSLIQNVPFKHLCMWEYPYCSSYQIWVEYFYATCCSMLNMYAIKRDTFSQLFSTFKFECF